MSDSRSISGSVELDHGSRELVALKLLEKISFEESGNKDRDYFLILYRQCYKATGGRAIADILKRD